MVRSKKIAYRRSLTAATLFLSAMTLSAAPEIEKGSVELVQRGNRRIAVSYTLSGGPAVVTVDFLTNGVSVGAARFRSLEGAVNARVPSGANTLYWNVAADWPEFKVTDNSLTAVVTAWADTCPPDYMALDLTGNGGTNYYVSADAVPGGVKSDIYKTTKLLMRKISAANRTFRMGAPRFEPGYSTTHKARMVTLTEDFYIGVYPFTQGQQMLVCGNVDQCTFTGEEDSPLRPANGGSNKIFRNNADVSSNPRSGSVLRAIRTVTGMPVDLPTEAQWEYACHAGVGASLYSGWDLEDLTTSARLGELAWYAGNSGGETHPVGMKEANAFGLYDMLGNVGELVLDQFTDSSHAPLTDPLFNGNGHIYKGGAFDDIASACRPACRWTGSAIGWSKTDPAHGFRCALVIR